MSKKMKAVAYLRVSDVSQINGTGFDRQFESIKEFNERNNFAIIREYRESHTGTDDNRPIFNAMVKELLNSRCHVIIIESLDRLARDLSVQINLLALLICQKNTLYNASTGQNITEGMQSDPMLKALVQIQGTFAELEKSMLIEKLQKARKKVKEKTGRCEGRKPYGYKPSEMRIINKIILPLYRKPRNEKRLGYYQIATILNRQLVPTRTGALWRGSTVKNIITRYKKSY